MMKKKILCTILISVLAISCVACGKKSDNGSGSASSAVEKSNDDVSTDDKAAELTFTYDELADGTIGIRTCEDGVAEVVIPDTYDGKTISALGSTDGELEYPAFVNDTNIKSVVLSDNIKHIYERSFANSSIEEIDLGNSIESISNDTFLQCSLKEVTFPSTLNSIGNLAFSLCKDLEKVTFLGDVENIDDGAFMGCSSDMTICGPAGSNVEAFATKKGFNFVAQ